VSADDETPFDSQAWIDDVMRTHENIVRDAVDAAFEQTAAEREKAESQAFMRGMLVGSFVGVVVWVLILLAVFAVFFSG